MSGLVAIAHRVTIIAAYATTVVGGQASWSVQVSTRRSTASPEKLVPALLPLTLLLTITSQSFSVSCCSQAACSPYMGRRYMCLPVLL